MLAFLGKAVISGEECCMPNIVHGTVVVFRFHFSRCIDETNPA